jgi:hypothetical protein
MEATPHPRCASQAVVLASSIDWHWQTNLTTCTRPNSGTSHKEAALLMNAPLQTLQVDADTINVAMIAPHQTLVVVASQMPEPRWKDRTQCKLYSTELRFESQKSNAVNECSPPNSGGGRRHYQRDDDCTPPNSGGSRESNA